MSDDDQVFRFTEPQAFSFETVTDGRTDAETTDGEPRWDVEYDGELNQADADQTTDEAPVFTTSIADQLVDAIEQLGETLARVTDAAVANAERRNAERAEYIERRDALFEHLRKPITAGMLSDDYPKLSSIVSIWPGHEDELN